MKIALLSPPYRPEYMRNARCDFISLSATQWYPILLGYCGAFLEKRGYEVKLIDAPAHYLTHEATDGLLREYQPDLLVLYTGFMSEDNDLAFGDKMVSQLGCDAVIVGPFAGIQPEKTLSKSRLISKLIVGEFEKSIAEIIRGRNAREIQNLVYKENGRIHRNPNGPHLTGSELDDIPFVSDFFQRQVDVTRYRTSSELYPFLDILTGRGCHWGQCTYCLWVHTYICGRTYHLRSMANVIEEFRYIEEILPHIRSVMIQDDTFTADRIIAFCRAKVEAGVKLPWSCYSRANLDIDVLRWMKRAGCRNLHVGYESANPEVLKKIRKGITVDRMTVFTKDAKRVGLRIHGDFAFGFPDETVQNAQQTIDWAYALNPDTAQFQLMIPFPGTPYFKEMDARGWLNKNGQPDMPNFSNAQIRRMAKKAYRKFYLSPKFFWKCCCHPYDHFFGRLKTISRAIPAMFWKPWQV